MFFIKKVYFLLIFLNISVVILFAQGPPPAPKPVTEELGIALFSIDSTLNLRWNGDKYCNTNYSADLFPAHSNNGNNLLKASTIKAVNNLLIAFDSIGIKTISIHINFPILVNGFPNSNDYLLFYKEVVSLVKNKKFKLFITSQTSPVDSALSSLEVSNFYSSLTTQNYQTDKLQMLQTIIDELNPDYLTIDNEPTNSEKYSALNFSPEQFYSNINYFLKNLLKKTVLLGAGAGSWESLDYFNRIAQLPLDYLDMHVFPIYFNSFFNNTTDIAKISSDNNKKLIIGDCWLYKANTNEALYDTVTAPAQIWSENVFDTYISLDSTFISCIYKLSNLVQSELTSFTGSQYFFGYVEYFPKIHGNMIPKDRFVLAATIENQNITDRIFSLSGITYKDILSNYCVTDVIKYNKQERFMCFPVPADNFINVFINSESDKHCNLKIFNFQGTLIKSIFKEFAYKGEQNININTSNLYSGNYILSIETPSSVTYKKFSVIHNY